MKKVALIIAMVLVVVISGCTAAGENPNIRVTPSSYDFGDMPKETVSHTFLVENTGSSQLIITQVSTSCGCTTAEVDSETIEPGQSTEMLVTFDPNLMDSEGNVFRIVYIKSNDPEQPEIEVEIRANVISG
jgi:hypothetical protein